MAAVATHLADTSALARLRHPAVAAVLGPLIEAGWWPPAVSSSSNWAGLPAAAPSSTRCEPTGKQVTNGSPPMTRTGTARLMCRPRCGAAGSVRAVGFPDLLIAAVAERERVTLLHYDSDYDLIAQVTGQPMQWVVPRGTVP